MRERLVELIVDLTQLSLPCRELATRLDLLWLLPMMPPDMPERELVEWFLMMVASTGQAPFAAMVRALSALDGVDVERGRALELLATEIAALDEAAWESTFDEAPGLWTLIERRCRAHAPRVADNDLYIRRHAMHAQVEQFLTDDRNVFVLVGRSGMGKSTFIDRVIAEKLDAGHLALAISSASLPAELDLISARIGELLTGGGWPDLFDFLGYIERKAKRRNRTLLVAVDALNEFNRAASGLPPGPNDFLLYLDSLAERLATAGLRRVKLLVSLRPETWGDEDERIRDLASGKAYWVPPDDTRIGRELGRFDESEAREAFERYCEHFRVASRYTDLTDLTRYHLADPLLLKLATDLHKNRTLPVDLDITDLFARYERQILDSVPAAGTIISRMVGTMFEDDVVIVRDALDIAHCDDIELARELDPKSRVSIGSQLRGLNVLRSYGSVVRCSYDRYVEYLLSNELLRRIRNAAKHDRTRLLDVAYEVLRENLQRRLTLPTAQRALRRCLRMLLPERNSVTLVRRLALADETGLTLASSVLGVIAMRRTLDGDGIDLVDGLLAELRKHVDRVFTARRFSFTLLAQRPAFPIIDVVYRLLGETEYTHWRAAQSQEIQARHLQPAVETFRWAFVHPVAEISGAAILYLYFLWRDPVTRRVAEPITSAVIAEVGRLRFRTLAPRRTRRIEHVIGLLMLTLPDLVDKDDTPITLPQAIDFVKAMDLEHSRLLRRFLGLGALIGRQVRRRFARLPNPINLAELDNLYTDTAARHDLRQVLGLLRSKSVPRLALQLEQLTTPNGFVVQMLAFAISVGYEAADGATRSRLADEIREVLAKPDLEAHLEYAVALALYHINYFGRSGDRRTVELMGAAAHHILRFHRGVFRLHERIYDFNIVGTYGRVRQKHRVAEPGRVSHDKPLAFVLAALDDAVARSDAKYYLYVCKNVGLLGILSNPRDAFEILGHALKQSASAALAADGETIRTAIVQSLANIRALHRSDVDRWLLTRDDQALYAEVTQRDPEFDLSLFHSWCFEHLLFNILSAQHDRIGAPLIDILDGSLDRGDSLGALRYMLTRSFELMVGLVR